MGDTSSLLRGRDPNAPAELKPTPRHKGWGALSDMLRAGRDFANKADLPVIGPLGDATIGKAPEEVNEWSYGNMPVQINPLAGRTASYVPEIKRGRKEGVADVVGALLPSPTGRKAAVAAATGGLGGHAGVDAASYLTHLPSKPNPLVGTRYERETVGKFVPKTEVPIEDLKDASINIFPWDSSSRGEKVTSISDVKLPKPVITTGGRDFARDAEHVAADIAGASNLPIAKRVQSRNEQTRLENLAAGGSGKVFSLPVTMGPEAEYFSTMPVEALTQLLRAGGLTKQQMAALDEMVRTAPLRKPEGIVRPFGGFVGFGHPDYEQQLLSGMGIDTTSGNLRKAITEQLTKVGPQKMIGYNKDDLLNALRDPTLLGVEKGRIGGTLIENIEGTPLSPSTHPAYDTNFGGRYRGTLGVDAPVEVLMPETFERLGKEFAGKTGDLRNMVLGAMEKRGSGFSEKIGQRQIDSFNTWRDAQKKMLREGSY